MLRKVRLTLGMLCLVFVTLLFVDFTGVLHAWLGWMAKIQFLPALLALNAGVIVCLILLTLIAGRVYCSVICPLGVFQDVVARLGRGRKKMPYTYSKPKSWLRYGVLAVFVLAMLLGVHALVALLDPYAVYGRAAHSFLAAFVDVGKQPAGFYGRTHGQLCLLFGRCLAQESAGADSGSCHAGTGSGTGGTQRTYLL